MTGQQFCKIYIFKINWCELVIIILSLLDVVVWRDKPFYICLYELCIIKMNCNILWCVIHAIKGLRYSNKLSGLFLCAYLITCLRYYVDLITDLELLVMVTIGHLRSLIRGSNPQINPAILHCCQVTVRRPPALVRLFVIAVRLCFSCNITIYICT